MTIQKKALKGIFWSGIQSWGSQAGSFIIFLILARLLTPSAFGLVALANLFINLFQLVLSFGFIQKLIQKENVDEVEINTVFWTQIFFSFLFTCSIFFTVDYIADNFHQPLLTPVLKSLSFLFIINTFSETQRALLVREFAFKALAIRSLLGIIFAGIVGIFMAFNNYGVWSLVGQQLTYEITGVLVLWTASDWRPKLQFSVSHLQSFLSFGINIFGYKLTQFFNQRTDVLLVGYFLGEITLGYYAIAHRILEIMTQLLIGTLNQVALPLFARLQNDSQHFLETFYNVTQWTCLITFPVFFSVIILSPELIVTLFGEKWLNVIPIMQILNLVGIIRGITLFQKSAFIALGKPNLQFKLGLINSILNFIFCLIAIPWGVKAIAIAYVMSDYVAFPIGQWMLTKLIHISIPKYINQFIAPFLNSVIMIITIYLFKKIFSYLLIDSWIILVSCTLIGVIVYIFTIRLFTPKLFNELLELSKIAL